jgi:hypothetical protein
MKSTRAASVAFVLLAGTGSCTGARSAADFDGSPSPPFTFAHLVRVADALPAGYESLGQVSAHCSSVPLAPRWRGEWLSDVDCSTERLTRVLRERAAEVGGELLAALRCGTRPLRPTRNDVRCHAEVGRPGDERRGERAFARVSGPVSDASEAWNIRVDFTPTGKESYRPPRAVSELSELPEIPVSHVVLGELATRCRSACSELGAHEGLLVAAARRGANSIAMPSCRAWADGWLCTATATAYAVDPERVPGAR